MAVGFSGSWMNGIQPAENNFISFPLMDKICATDSPDFVLSGRDDGSYRNIAG
ncbi:MAG TPA: hypothetical protein VGM64_09550 [Lacunisphaera sp.]